MSRRLIIIIVVIIAVVAGGLYYARHDSGRPHWTGFVEGEERILRAEVSGRILEVRFGEGDKVPAQAVVAVLDDRDIQAKVASKRQEIAALDAQMRTEQEKIQLVESTWKRDVLARSADVNLAQSSLDVAQRSLVREQELVKTGASTLQLLDDQR